MNAVSLPTTRMADRIINWPTPASTTSGPYYQLAYTGFDYIGSDGGKFYLQHVNFDKPGKTRINYKNQILSGQTTKDDFIKMFGQIAREHFANNPGEQSILLYSKGSDDGAVFTFEDNRLVKFQYWTPC
jgi:hypothetical protein